LAVFAYELRQLRRAAGGLSYRALARRAGYSAAALSAAAGGVTFPSLSVTLAYVGACGGNTDEWAQGWRELEAKLAVDTAPPRRPPLAPGGRAPSGSFPRELPPDVYAFSGRSAELTELDRLTGSGGRAGSVIVALSGTAGVGKTALAVHWAHRNADRYPDGQLYVDLRGYGPEPPTEPGEVLAGFLRALGVTPADVPYDLAERTARYRSLLADRRMLVLLDNAPSADAVRPLLPGSPSCLTLVTSRDSLAGLVARHGARRVDLPRLPAPEALDLLATLIGGRVAAEPVPAVALMEGCARLPLALRIAAELAATRPASSLADLVNELGDERSRLERLAAGADERTAVRSVLSWSYHRLTRSEAALFRALGLHPGPDIDAAAAAALGGIDVADAQRDLAALVRAHLVEPVEADRYAQHDLLRAYAAARSDEEDPTDLRVAGLGRLIGHYLTSAAAAMEVLVPAERARDTGSGEVRFADAAAARAWLDAHRPALVATIAFAAERGWPAQAARLAETLWRYFDTAGHYLDALSTQDHALAIVRDRGDRAAEATALHHIATVHRRWGRYDEAAERCREALAIQREIGDRAGMGASLNTLGVLSRRQGRYDDAVEHYRQAMECHREVGDEIGMGLAVGNLAIVYDQLGRYADSVAHHERALALLRDQDERGDVGIILGNLGVAHGRNGDYAKAVDHLERALGVLREVGNRAAEGDFLDELGVVHHRWGEPEKAHEYLCQALAIQRELGNRDGQAAALVHLAATYLRTDRPSDALRYARQALDVAREIGERRVESSALDCLGATMTALGQPGTALRHHEQALALAEELDDRYGQARGLDGLGRALAALGRVDEARRRREFALELLADLDVPEAAELRDALSTGM
jgi:tetratricopeptide (TPR) repeat protein/transcriptional regulator with XRE-family HTH domain